MNLIWNTVVAIGVASWDVLLESAPYMLFGFAMAGLLKAFVPANVVERHLGRSGFANVLKAALFGVPLPLCSCGVVPAAAGLRKQGASKGATAAFLISTPESGVDSVAISYALLDPLMTLLRPLAAFFTATLAGVMVNSLEQEGDAAPELKAAPCSGPGCGCTATACDLPEAAPTQPPVLRRALSGLAYAFDDLLVDIGVWFLVGVVLAGAITALVPDTFIESNLGSGFLPMLLMLVAAVPMYVCATSSTPIAAALALKGISPGAALVFLLAGPATNAASIAMVAKILGRRVTAIYLGAIVVSSLSLGMLVNWLYLRLGLSVTDWVRVDTAQEHSWWHLASALILLIFIVRGILSQCCRHDHYTTNAPETSSGA
ncbi:MAG: SO_0444 family Cu/Zn efflux transporter [Proteobacteria bacterium]|nr:SO_0444 family Cu/Zn efflux transporter [Pseudomonadota bacterium]